MVDLPDLTQLRDIHLPNPVGWWPLAWGWTSLIGIVLLTTGLMTTLGYRRYKQGLVKRQACNVLANYEHAYQQERNTVRICANVSELLRRVALAYFPREEVASLQGEAWISFLNNTSKQVDFNTVRQCLLELPYQNQAQEVNLKPLFTQAYAWIKQRGIPCSN